MQQNSLSTLERRCLGLLPMLTIEESPTFAPFFWGDITAAQLAFSFISTLARNTAKVATGKKPSPDPSLDVICFNHGQHQTLSSWDEKVKGREDSLRATARTKMNKCMWSTCLPAIPLPPHLLVFRSMSYFRIWSWCCPEIVVCCLGHARTGKSCNWWTQVTFFQKPSTMLLDFLGIYGLGE